VTFTRASSGKSVGTLEEGKAAFSSCSARFDGRERFSRYRALGQSPKKAAKVGVAEDSRVPSTRFLTFRADETSEGDIQKSAQWRRSKQISEALSLSIPVDSWYNPSGELWEVNTIVTVKSKTLYIPDGFDFLVKEISFDFSENGSKATLGLVPPQAFSGEDIVEPW
jgi:prophage tail gpP-like protein